MRVFLQDYRPNIVGLLKRYNGLNGQVVPESKRVLNKIVNAYVALMSMAEFVEVSFLLNSRVLPVIIIANLTSTQFEDESTLDGRFNGFT